MSSAAISATSSRSRTAARPASRPAKVEIAGGKCRLDVPAHPPPNRYWLVVGTCEREVCVHDPGYGDDAVVTADVATLVAWHCGRLTLGQAQRAGMRVVATPADERMLDAWGRLSPFADVAPALR